MELTLSEVFKTAIEAHQSGQAEKAKGLYEAILKVKPNHPKANHNLGLLVASSGQLKLALSFFNTALKANPNIDQFWLSYIDILIQLKRIDDATLTLNQAKAKGIKSESFKKLEKRLDEINSTPKGPPLSQVQSIISLYSQGRFTHCLTDASRMLNKFPNSVVLYNISGACNAGLMQFDAAITSFKKALKLEPNNAEAYNNIGNALNAQGDQKAAIVSYKKAIDIKPDFPEAFNNIGNALTALGVLDAAIDNYKHALMIKPNYAEAYNNMAITLNYKSQPDAAINSCMRALKFKPDYAEAYFNKGIALQNKGDSEAAMASYKQALQIAPGYAEVHNNLGKVLKDRGNLASAINSFEQAVKIKPDYADAYYNLSYPYLLQGSVEKGFNFYESRLRKTRPTVAPARAHLIWDGKKSLSGKHFVIYEEQGLGDIIQFCRYLPPLEQKGANITFKVKPNLHALLETMDSNSRLVTSLPEENKIDFETPLMSIPHLLNTSLETIPATNPYLFADQDKIQTWAERVSTNRFKVGICWQGSKTKMDIGRSFPLSLFEGISRIPNLELISLHKGEGEAQIDGIDFDLTTFGHDFDAGQDSFLDTVAVMMNCDLIITSDTAVAHLAGAIGQPTWVVLKQIPDWRWMLERPDSPWYPTMTLYRQKTQGEWVDVFDTIERDLRTMLKQKKDVK